MELPVNERLEILLQQYKISQKQLAELTGISENTISNAKNGKNVPGVEFFNAIYCAFPGINHNWIYMGMGSMFVDGVSQDMSLKQPKNRKSSSEDYLKITKLMEKEITQYLYHYSTRC